MNNKSNHYYRGRRYRNHPILRESLTETIIEKRTLVQPVFITEAETAPVPISSMPGIQRYPLESSLRYVETLMNSGINKIILFGIPAEKDALGKEAYNTKGVIQNAVREFKKKFGNDIYIITDVCMCEYTSHGHCGIIKNQNVDNDSTLPYLSRIALSHVEAGADMVAPSDMMDGRIQIIREGLDNNGFTDIPIMSYSVKYASAFYGPFREAADSAPEYGDRKGYQLNPASRKKALLEGMADISEGSDIIMVKPALPYLDILNELKNRTDLPLAAYQVSGEYAMIKAASEKGWLDEKTAINESLLSIKRAGADLIITYFAQEVANDK